METITLIFTPRVHEDNLRKHMGKGLAHSRCSGIEDSFRLWHFIALGAILSSYFVLNMYFSDVVP